MSETKTTDVATVARDFAEEEFFAAALWGACLALSGVTPSPIALAWLSRDCAELVVRTGGTDARDVVLDEIVSVLRQAPQWCRVDKALAYAKEELRICREYGAPPVHAGDPQVRAL